MQNFVFKLVNLQLLIEESISKAFWNNLKKNISDPATWTTVLFTFIKIVVILIVGRVIVRLANKAMAHMMVERERKHLKFDQRRTNTIGRLLGNIVTYSVNFITILLILMQFGFNLTPLLAGAGVLGLAIGFGAQSLVKDVITGFFIIFEDQFAIGDVIQTRTFKGTVEEIGLRVTRIKSSSGEVYIIPNGSIQEVTNYSIYNSIAMIDIAVAYKEDPRNALELLKVMLTELYDGNTDMVRLPELLGVEVIGQSEVILRIQVECKPNTQGAVTRAIKEAAVKAFEQKETLNLVRLW
ncbi:mechanosensitive ion channel family protein [Paenibacillus psychroresistens]|uniref:Mechanosensitive ion channel family protein n=1 Tax=Paenibacillus psychroresistens TaxID=1778678 RepID=A0A6B8RTN1_9BACL|nr:mechanosensitive ion channel family protein [Paenibacillus psychroresistens]QGQ99880.1 mechanosensitive ion channel family protein [Paenibacillus psychroresistens]